MAFPFSIKLLATRSRDFLSYFFFLWCTVCALIKKLARSRYENRDHNSNNNNGNYSSRIRQRRHYLYLLWIYGRHCVCVWISRNFFKLDVVVLRAHTHMHTQRHSCRSLLKRAAQALFGLRYSHWHFNSIGHSNKAMHVPLATTFHENDSWRFWSCCCCCCRCRCCCYENCDAIVALNCTVEDIDILHFRFVSIFRFVRPRRERRNVLKRNNFLPLPSSDSFCLCCCCCFLRFAGGAH